MMLLFIAVTIMVFCLMELVSYVVHRYLYHRTLWFIHRSHHVPRRGPFELNDVFPVVFAAGSCLLLGKGFAEGPFSLFLAAGIGMTAYGLVYFLVHDLYIHRRTTMMTSKIPFLLPLKRAHMIHHRTGGEPYGLLLFLRVGLLREIPVTEEDAVVPGRAEDRAA